MQFKEANKKLKEISKGEYRSVLFELKTFGDGRTETRCRVYFHPGIYGDGSTWDRVFEALGDMVNGCAVEETPDIDDGTEVKNDSQTTDSQ